MNAMDGIMIRGFLSLTTDFLLQVMATTIPILLFFLGWQFNRSRDKKERAHALRIQMDIEHEIVGRQEGHYLLQLYVILENKGRVRKQFEGIDLDIRGIKKSEPIEQFEQWDKENQLNLIPVFPLKLVDTMIPLSKPNPSKAHEKKQTKRAYFVEPGIRQKLSYVAKIPDHISFLRVVTKFKYHQKSEHTLEKVIAIKNNQKENHNGDTN